MTRSELLAEITTILGEFASDKLTSAYYKLWLKNIPDIVAKIMASVDRYTASQSPINHNCGCGSKTAESERQTKES